MLTKTRLVKKRQRSQRNKIDKFDLWLMILNEGWQGDGKTIITSFWAKFALFEVKTYWYKPRSIYCFCHFRLWLNFTLRLIFSQLISHSKFFDTKNRLDFLVRFRSNIKPLLQASFKPRAICSHDKLLIYNVVINWQYIINQ